MKKFWLLLCSFFLVAAVGAQEGRWREIPFSELGWETDRKLEGSNPVYTLYFPNFPAVDWEQSYLYLQVETPPALSSDSSISVYGDGNLLRTTALQSGIIPIPLKSLSPQEEQHRIEIQPYLFISNNLCEDLASGNLFCILKKESRLFLFFRETQFSTLTDFLNVPDNYIEIILPPSKWSRELLEAYLSLYVFLRRFFRNLPMHIETRVSEEERSFLPDRRRIFLRESGERDFELHGKSLTLTPQGVKALLQNQKILVFSSATIPTVKNPPEKSVRRIPLEGFSFRGIGNLTETFYFASADLGGIPKTLKLVLYRSHSPLRANFQGDASFTVRLNGETIYTERLSPNPATSRTPQTIVLPVSLLRRENALEFRFSYFPEIGNCRRGETPLEATISRDSYIEIQGEGPRPDLLTWDDVPTFFWGKGFVVLPEDPSLQDLQISSAIAASLRVLDRTPIDFTVITPEEAERQLASPPLAQSWQNPLARITRAQEYFFRYASHLETINMPLPQKLMALSLLTIEQCRILLGEAVFFLFSPFLDIETQKPLEYFIFVATPRRPLSSPLFPEGNDLVLKDISTTITLMRFGPLESLAILTTFWENAHPVILFATHGQREQAIQNFLGTFQEEKTLRRLTGNIAIFGKKGLSSTLAGTMANPSKNEIAALGRWLWQFRLFILLFLAGLVVILAGLLYNRLVHPKTP